MEFPERRALARQLLQKCSERTSAQGVAEDLPAGSSVFQELRTQLCRVIGPSGVQALFLRAIKEGAKRAPALEALVVRRGGEIEGIAELEARGERDAGEIFLAELLGLLFTLVGEDLTARLLVEVWPDVSLDVVRQISKKGRKS